jgi:hypothetical protein
MGTTVFKRIKFVAFALTAACIALAPVCAAAASAQPVPRTEQRRIVAMFGRTLLPSELPPGYVYSRWYPEPGSSDISAGNLVVEFGRHGALLDWSAELIADPKSESHVECIGKLLPWQKVITVGSRRVIYSGGARGATATVCLGKQAVVAWTAYQVNAAALARFAASARTVG